MIHPRRRHRRSAPRQGFVLCLLIALAQTSIPVSLNAAPETDTSTRALQVVGNHLFVAAWGYGVQVLDISAPTRPRWIGGWNPRRCPVGLHVSGNYAYVADRLAGLTVLNVANPAKLAQVGNVDTPGDATAVDVAGHYAYVADGPGGLQIVNIADPTRPKLVGRFPIPPRAQRALSVGVSGNRAWVITLSGVHVVDVSNPAAPALVTQVSCTSSPFAQVQFSADHAFVAGPRLLGFHLADPSQPIQMDGLLAKTNDLPIIVWTGPTTFATPGRTRMLTNASFVKMLRDRFSTNMPRDMAEIVENLRRSPDYYQYTLFPGGLQHLHLLGSRLLSISGGSLKVIDPTEPATPRIIREFKLGIPVGDVHGTGRYAYIADLRGAGRYAYVMDSGAHIYVVDLEDAISPGPVARFDSHGYVSAVLTVRDAGRAIVPAQNFTGVPSATNAPVLVDPERLANGAFSFTLRAQAGADYVVQVSSDFVSWTAFRTNTLPESGELCIADPDAAMFPNRFYRAVRTP